MYSAQRHLTPWFSAMMDGELMFAESELPQPLVMYTASLPTFLYATKSVKYCLPVALSHKRRSPLSSAEAIDLPSGEKATW